MSGGKKTPFYEVLIVYYLFNYASQLLPTDGILCAAASRVNSLPQVLQLMVLLCLCRRLLGDAAAAAAAAAARG